MNHESLKQLLEECLEASAHCSRACLLEEDSYVLTRCSKLNHTAVIICKLVTKAMGSSTELLTQVCRLCIEICTTCAEECEKFTQLEHCNRSAIACRNIVAECRLYLATVSCEYYAKETNERYELY